MSVRPGAPVAPTAHRPVALPLFVGALEGCCDVRTARTARHAVETTEQELEESL